MTNQQIELQKHYETIRHNRAMERAASQQNVEAHRSNLARETELNRHQLETENQGRSTIALNSQAQQEQGRHNLAAEAAETARTAESRRHSQAQEALTLHDVNTRRQEADTREFAANNQAALNAQQISTEMAKREQMTSQANAQRAGSQLTQEYINERPLERAGKVLDMVQKVVRTVQSVTSPNTESLQSTIGFIK
nr:putative ORF1 [Marmot picobirnavirus]